MKLNDLKKANTLLETIKLLENQMLSDCYDAQSKEFYKQQILKCYEEIEKI